MKNTFFKYGLYNVWIKYDQSKKKLFRFNKTNWYTQIDLARAKELNLNMNLLVGDQANFLYYPREKLLAGTELFKNYVDHLFALKQQNIPRSKCILNILWGALSQKAYNKKTINNNDDVYIIPDNCELDAFKPFDDDNTLIEVFNNDHQYKMGFARICPFLISKGRKPLCYIWQEHNFKLEIMRVHRIWDIVN